MPVADIEVRVSRLEHQLDHVLRLLAERPDPAERKTDIKKIAGYFGNDPFMKSVMKSALKYREDDRRKARSPKAKRRRPKP